MINRIKKYLNRKRVLGSIKRFCKCNSDEIGTKEILKYLEKYEPTYFNYYWFRNYNLLENYDIQKDDGRYYINYCGHRMYFKKQWDFDQVIRYLKNLLPEQDKRSPHLYFAEGEKKAHYGCVIDAGGG